ncbi:MAG: hypothetical protein EBR82_34430 [Caulobacteraceae bacterium]|nr:hypothetical protein [Caulobacteraceae bacterium]
MTDTVNVLPHLKQLRADWRKQNFNFTKEQKEKYELLTLARYERIRFFKENDLVAKGPKVSPTDEVIEEDY